MDDATFDYIITGGTIIDGSGNPGFKATLGIRKDEIRMLRGDVSGLMCREKVNADGKVVAPGFIDMHSHSGLLLLAHGEHEPKVHQGITTEVIGIDGISYAPVKSSHDLEELVHFNSGIDGRPRVPYTWDSVASYLSRLDGKTSVNIAFLVGNSALRLWATGWNQIAASKRDRATMAELLREGIQAGAFGLSTGLDYPPGAYADTSELIELSAVAAALGGIYHTHVRYQLGDRYLDPFKEAIEIGRRAEVPVHITHFYHRVTYPGGTARMFDMVDEALAEGISVTFDTFPSEWGSSNLLLMLPPWVLEGGPQRLLERLSSEDTRNRLRDEIDSRARFYGGPAVWSRVRLGNLQHAKNRPYEGRMLASYMELTGKDAMDAICDLLITEDLGVNIVIPGAHGATLPPFIAHPRGMIGTDSIFLGDYPSPRTYGSFPRVLGEFVREERILPLTEAIRKMTTLPAQTLGIRDRGLLRDGMRADVVILDPATVAAAATFDEPTRLAIGISHVFVNGVLVIKDGKHEGVTPGRVLRMHS